MEGEKMKKKLLNLWYTILYQFDSHRGDIPEEWYETKPFEYLPLNLQRIKVAKDIITQIKAEKYTIEDGIYVRFNGEINKGDDIKSTFFDGKKHCEVCALGACLMSIVHFKNTLKYNEIERGREFVEDKKVARLLQDVFSLYQLALIEFVFEEGNAFYAAMNDFNLDLKDQKRCYLFRIENYRGHTRLGRNENLLLAIMENIILNNGTFIP